VCPEIVLL